jgi:hypothetical protein
VARPAQVNWDRRTGLRDEPVAMTDRSRRLADDCCGCQAVYCWQLLRVSRRLRPSEMGRRSRLLRATCEWQATCMFLMPVLALWSFARLAREYGGPSGGAADHQSDVAPMEER